MPLETIEIGAQQNAGVIGVSEMYGICNDFIVNIAERILPGESMLEENHNEHTESQEELCRRRAMRCSMAALLDANFMDVSVIDELPINDVIGLYYKICEERGIFVKDPLNIYNYCTEHELNDIQYIVDIESNNEDMAYFYTGRRWQSHITEPLMNSYDISH